jgi:hypothetical protein
MDDINLDLKVPQVGLHDNVISESLKWTCAAGESLVDGRTDKSTQSGCAFELYATSTVTISHGLSVRDVAVTIILQTLLSLGKNVLDVYNSPVYTKSALPWDLPS